MKEAEGPTGPLPSSSPLGDVGERFSPSDLPSLLAVRQYADICLFSTAQYKCPVAQIEQE